MNIDETTIPTIEDVLQKDKDLAASTGISTLLEFKKLCEAVDYVTLALNIDETKFKMSSSQRVLMTLMKLKLNLSFLCLSSFFHVHPTTCTDYFFYTIDILHAVLSQFIVWFPKEKINQSMPIYFKEFQDTRVVVDCFEVRITKTKCLNCTVRTYSHYKGTNTVKILLGVAPCGTITFVSKVYGGRASDKFIFNDSKLAEKCEPQDAIMADKGFAIEDECANANLKLYRPPFFDSNKKQFDEEENTLCRKVARARVHVERAIQRIRLFKILNDKLQWLFMSNIDKIIRVVCALVNLSSPILSDERF